MPENEEKLTDGMLGASTTDTVRHAISFVVGILLSRLAKYNLLTSEEMSYVYGFLPSLIFNVGFAYWKRYQQRKNIVTALKMPPDSSVAELKAALSSSAPTAVLSVNENSVVVVKEVIKEEEKI
jgi:hypothetical protein